jgi:hypothetical protein
MTENYSGNIKIREKPSMDKRHNLCFVEFSDLEFLREKSALLANSLNQKN